MTNEDENVIAMVILGLVWAFFLILLIYTYIWG